MLQKSQKVVLCKLKAKLKEKFMKRAQSMVEICMLAGLVAVITIAVFVSNNHLKENLVNMSKVGTPDSTVVTPETGGICDSNGCHPVDPPGGGGKGNPNGGGNCIPSETGGVCTSNGGDNGNNGQNLGDNWIEAGGATTSTGSGNNNNGVGNGGGG